MEVRQTIEQLAEEAKSAMMEGAATEIVRRKLANVDEERLLAVILKRVPQAIKDAAEDVDGEGYIRGATFLAHCRLAGKAAIQEVYPE